MTRCDSSCNDASTILALLSISPALNHWPPRFSAFAVAQLQCHFRARSLCASSLALRLTNRSTGHFAACGNWASFHSRPIAAHRKMPVNSNVRQHQCKLFNHRYALLCVVEISTSRNGCLSSSQKRSLLPFAQHWPNLASQHARALFRFVWNETVTSGGF